MRVYNFIINPESKINLLNNYEDMGIYLQY